MTNGNNRLVTENQLKALAQTSKTFVLMQVGSISSASGDESSGSIEEFNSELDSVFGISSPTSTNDFNAVLNNSLNLLDADTSTDALDSELQSVFGISSPTSTNDFNAVLNNIFSLTEV